MSDMSFLFAVFQEFVRCTNKDIEQIIKKEMSGDVKRVMYAIGKVLQSPFVPRSLSWAEAIDEKWMFGYGKILSLFHFLSPTSFSFPSAVCSVKNQSLYFADRLYKAMKVDLFVSSINFCPVLSHWIADHASDSNYGCYLNAGEGGLAVLDCLWLFCIVILHHWRRVAIATVTANGDFLFRAWVQTTGHWSASWLLAAKLTFSIFAKSSRTLMKPPSMNSSR